MKFIIIFSLALFFAGCTNKQIITQMQVEYVLEKWGDEPLGLAIKRNKDNIYAGFVHIDTRGKKARWEYK